MFQDGEKSGGFKTARRVEVSRRREEWRFQDGEKCGGFKTARKVSQDNEKSADGWTRTRATQNPQRAERRQNETKVSMD